MDHRVAPGMRPKRLARLIERAVDSTKLDLNGLRVLTEAATGAYVVTPVIAALAGASRVDAVTRSTRYGSVEQVREETEALAELLGVTDRIRIASVEELPALVPTADVLTNSGHVRPIDDRLIQSMRPTCVVPLMFEAWEIDLGRDDLDLEALRARSIRFAGTNERHPTIDVFSHLGPMAVQLLSDAAVSVHGSQLVVLCDNPFAPYLERGLSAAGARVTTAERFEPELVDHNIDAVVVALRPTSAPVLDREDLAALRDRAPGAILAQFWGDVSRADCEALDLDIVPAADPGAGHMGVLPSAVGPEPIVRLQTGGLKVASILRIPESQRSPADLEYLDEL